MNPFKAIYKWLISPRAEIQFFEYNWPGYSKATILYRGKLGMVFGNCTVWHHANTGERMSTWIECILADRWALEVFRRGSITK